MTKEELKNMIKEHEGYVDSVYLCSEGVPTAGWGHAFHEGSYIGEHVAELLFQYDYDAAVMHAHNFLEMHQLHHLNIVRKAVLVDMIFNLGLGGLNKFKRFIRAMRGSDYMTASREMLDSKWARQVKGRAIKLSKMMELGRVE